MWENMDDGEVETSEEALFPNHPCSLSNFHGSISGDLLKNARTCSHTHTCNPLGPDLLTLVESQASERLDMAGSGCLFRFYHQ